MSTEIASLGMKVDATSVNDASTALQGQTNAAKPAADDLSDKHMGSG